MKIAPSTSLKSLLVFSLLSVFYLTNPCIAEGSQTSSGTSSYMNVNIIGNDIGVAWNVDTASQCENECSKNSNCKAWTWVKPGALPKIQRPQQAGFCALKDSLSDQLVKDDCCVSGYTTYTISGYGEMVNPDKAMQIATYNRFKIVMNGEAVLDDETGLLWERNPDIRGGSEIFWIWKNAEHACLTKIIGNRKGWRLPTVWELSSLHFPGTKEKYFGFSGPQQFWSSSFARWKDPEELHSKLSFGKVEDFSEKLPISVIVEQTEKGIEIIINGEPSFSKKRADIGSWGASPLCVRDWFKE